MPGFMSVVIEEENKGQLEAMSKLANFDEIASPRFESAMRVAVVMGKRKVIAELQAIAELNRSAMISGLGGDMQPLAPVNPKVPSMRISDLVVAHGAMDITGIIGDPTKKYLRLTEGGRGPGRHPPARKLQDWAENVLGVQPGPGRIIKSGKRKGQHVRDVSAGRAIAHAIAERGIKGSPVMEKSGEAVEKHVMQLFEVELRKIAAELGYK